jgi:3-oxoadipate enol-lactonase
MNRSRANRTAHERPARNRRPAANDPVDRAAAGDPHPARPLDDFDRGVKNRRAVLGDAWVDKSLDNANDVQRRLPEPDHALCLARHLGPARPRHDDAAPAGARHDDGLARWEEFELHCRAAIRGGVALATIKETLMQGAIYCGVPAANTAFKITMEILREEGPVPAPRRCRAATRVAHHTFSQPQLASRCRARDAGRAEPCAGLDQRMWDACGAPAPRTHGAALRPPRPRRLGGPRGPYTMDDLVDDAARLIREWGAARWSGSACRWAAWSGRGSRSASRAGARPRDREQRLALSGRRRAVVAERIAKVEQGGSRRSPTW